MEWKGTKDGNYVKRSRKELDRNCEVIVKELERNSQELRMNSEKNDLETYGSNCALVYERNRKCNGKKPMIVIMLQ